jgi:hypothetical protein
VSPLETDTHAMHAKLGCEAAQLIAKGRGGLGPTGRCGDLLSGDFRERGVQFRGRGGNPREQVGDLEQDIPKGRVEQIRDRGFLGLRGTLLDLDAE